MVDVLVRRFLPEAAIVVEDHVLVVDLLHLDAFRDTFVHHETHTLVYLPDAEFLVLPFRFIHRAESEADLDVLHLHVAYFLQFCFKI